jgi:hypothetical protein
MYHCFLSLPWRERIEVRVVCAFYRDPHPCPLPQAGEGVLYFRRRTRRARSLRIKKSGFFVSFVIFVVSKIP